MCREIEVTATTKLIHKLDEALNTYFEFKYIETSEVLQIQLDYVGEKDDRAFYTLKIEKEVIENESTKKVFLSIMYDLSDIFKESIRPNKLNIIRKAYPTYVEKLDGDSKEMKNIPSAYSKQFNIEDLKDLAERETNEYTLKHKKEDYFSTIENLIQSIYDSKVISGNHIFSNFKTQNEYNALDYAFYNTLKAFRQKRFELKYIMYYAEQIKVKTFDELKHDLRDKQYILVYVRGINLEDEFKAIRKIYDIATENDKQLLIFSKPTIKSLFKKSENNIISPEGVFSSVYLNHHGLVRKDWEVQNFRRKGE